ncbi:MAG: hypothetical protein JO115_01530 [Pseudonocardiales bacterium]|nr:hypothetical protein [Pseudonocardiales bacterium]
MTRLGTWYSAAVAVLLVVILSGCTAFVNDQNKEANDLGLRIVSQLKAQPSVADANYTFKSSLDVSPRMAVSVLVKPEQATHDRAQRLVDLAMDAYWHSSADVQTFSVSVYSVAHPPVAGQDNQKREIAGGEVHLNADQQNKSTDQRRLEEKFGPRPTPTPTK